MIYQNIEFFNVEALEKKGSLPGLMLQRFPEKICLALGEGDHERGRFYGQVSTCCEIRFVTDARFFRISLSAWEGSTRVFVFRGDYLHSVQNIPAGTITTLHVELPPHLNTVEPSFLSGGRYSPNIWRILFDKGGCGCFCHLDLFGHQARPPKPEETPRIHWLAYGSSITFGGNTHLITNAYVQQAARRLGVDVWNKAVAGSCFCDPCMASYLAGVRGWDFATLELGINMLGRFSPGEFELRARRLASVLREANPTAPIFFITPFPAGAGYRTDPAAQDRIQYHAFTEILRKIQKEQKQAGDTAFYLLEGTEILTHPDRLSSDLLHPSDDGHILMGDNLAKLLKPIVSSL